MDVKQQNQSGFTLVELLVAVVLGMLVVAFVGNIYVDNIRATRDVSSTARLENDLRAIMALMTEEIRRAGYWGGSEQYIWEREGLETWDNPFHSATYGLQVNAGQDCILFTYDRNGDGEEEGVTPPTVAKEPDTLATDGTNEFFGFALDNNAVKLHTGAAGENWSCGDVDDWPSLTDEDVVQVDNLSFVFSGECIPADAVGTYDAALNISNGADDTKLPCHGDNLPTDWKNGADAASAAGDPPTMVELTDVTIRIEASLVHDATVTKTLTEMIKARNNRVVEWP